ncbi:transient receptor potential channel pyrexia-like [Pieris brassicae]|uniref:transient receptor potential channel pyrexia-like n=1 Tax=Pieris brassicae TaxID=7116 RepID=UPI001E6625ED|nr:transient receptor potential channel pyrexia-like [Pieris brassicae]
MERDIEQGIPEESETSLLLNSRSEQTASNERKHRPYPPLSLAPSSVLSTPDSSPAPDTASTWPKKWRRSDRRTRRLNTQLLEAIESHNVDEVERLLNSGANPNATCRLDLVSACHIAAINGGDSLGILAKHGAEKHRLDVLGRTPLHLAAYAGNTRQVAILLGFSEEMQKRVQSEDMSSDVEEDVKKLCPEIQAMVDVRCDDSNVSRTLPSSWKDNIDHSCLQIKGTLPLLQTGWTPLHVAVSCIRRHSTRLLLAAGADPNIVDAQGRTPLDVIASAYYLDVDIKAENFAEIIKMLTKAGGTYNTMKSKELDNIATPLHTAVELENINAITELLDIGASVSCLNSEGQTPMHLCVKKRLHEPLQVLANYEYLNVDPLSAVVDVKDKDGYTVLQEAVEEAWVPGVCIALEAGADVTLKAYDGQTPVHSAADIGNIDVLLEILSVARQKGIIDCQNEDGETALFKAIVNGNTDCVYALLEEGASIKIKLSGEVSVLHKAAEYGHSEILKILLEHNEGEAMSMIDSLSARYWRGFGPIHFAVMSNSVECVELLLSKNADVRLRTTDSPYFCSTPLHLAAMKNFIDVAKFIVKFDKTTIHEVNSKGWFPLHTASHHGCRDIITLLLQKGADLSGNTDGPRKYRQTAIDMILNTLSMPTEFLSELFDSYINSNCANFHDSNCEINIDYRILIPSVCEMEQMKVIEALLKTGNRYGQRKLLVHPLVKSFLHLKWKALLPFFYVIVILYSMLVSSLTIFTMSVFFYKDTASNPPAFLSPAIWANVVYVSVVLIILQEILYMNIRSKRYFSEMETWIKFGSICLAVILPLSINLAETADWPRHIATLALLFSWIELMFLLSRFPSWGYYVLMFGKVAINVIKILLTFVFIIVGFSLSFMIQFHTQIPFESPWAAFVKTVVMMTSEFDYQSLFDQENSRELATSLIVVRFIFLIFLILAAIVIMNLMVGVAVNDINDLAILGNIDRLCKQVQFLSTLDNLVYNRFFIFILPKRIIEGIKNKRRVVNMIILAPGKPKWKYYKALPTHLREAIFTIAQEKMKQKDNEVNMEEFKKKIDEMHTAVTNLENHGEQTSHIEKAEKPLVQKMKYDEIMKRLAVLDHGMDSVKDEVTNLIEETKNPVNDLRRQMSQISTEIESIKQYLIQLDKKLSK